jgi:hypothetical protein
MVVVNEIEGEFKMKSWYQIDRRNSNGTLASCVMVEAQSLDDAIRADLGTDYTDYIITKSRINGNIVLKAEFQAETASYIEVRKAAR